MTARGCPACSWETADLKQYELLARLADQGRYPDLPSVYEVLGPCPPHICWIAADTGVRDGARVPETDEHADHHTHRDDRREAPMLALLISYVLGVASGIGGLAGFAWLYMKHQVKTQKWPSL